IFKRGAAVQFVPTTLLAMVDASIGGKTGCDFNNYKNMIGTFFPAQKLYYWPEFVQFLPDNQYRSGLAEALKTGILYSEELFNIFKNEAEKITARDKDILEQIIKVCVKAKASVVEQDFTEQGIRAFLNLGHTFGHALESIAGLGAMTHGDAVAWGIGRAVTLSFKKEYCRETYKNEILEILEKYGWETNAVPPIVRGGGIGERFLNVMHKDKKNLAEKVRVIITKGIGETVIEEVSDAEILSVLK
ncbi:MAG: 3-dehydroquinate synthase, partial [Treponema sp.]|nr:3-dehydroquinate synthase [Treponema sp.]